MVTINNIFMSCRNIPDIIYEYNKEAPYLNNAFVYNRKNGLVDMLFPLRHSPYTWMIRNNNFSTYLLLNYKNIKYGGTRGTRRLCDLLSCFDVNILIEHKIRLVKYKEIYLIEDGNHRSSILLYKNPQLTKIDDTFLDIIQLSQSVYSKYVFDIILENMVI